MHLVQLPSICNTIQSISDISSLNVWTTLCLSHSAPGALWRGFTRYHFPIHLFFLSKQLFKAQLYILIHSEDLATQVAVALWRIENKPTLSDQAERKGHVGRLGQQKEAGIHEWSRNGPPPHFRSPICGAGCLSIHETKSSKTDIAASGCEFRVCGKGMLMVRNTRDDHAGRNNRTA